MQKACPSDRLFFELVEINFNVYVSDADVLIASCILEDFLYDLCRWHQAGRDGLGVASLCACSFKRCRATVRKRVVLHHTRLIKLNIRFVNPS